MGVQPDKFRYFLTLDNQRQQVVFAPDGWDKDTEVTYERSLAYFGLIRSLAVPLEFVLDGAAILRKAYYTYGIEAEVRIEVEQLQNATWSYLAIFRCDIDFSQFRDYPDHVSVTLMESGTARNVKAYETVKNEYALTGSDVVNIKLPGVAFIEEATGIFTPNIIEESRYIPGFDITKAFTTPDFAETRSTSLVEIGDGGFSGSDAYFVKAFRNLTINMKGNIRIGYFRGFFGDPGFSLQLRDQTNALVKELHYYPGPSAELNIPIDESIAMTEGQQLYFYIRGDSTQSWIILLEDSGQLDLDYSTTSDESDCKGITAMNLYKRIMRKISPGSAVSSHLLTNKWKNLIFTSGDGIREIEKAKIKISFKEFFDTINAIEDAGFGLENGTAALELASYFARDIQILDLGEVKDLSIEPARELIFNSIKVGYNDGNTDEKDGRQEYNSGQVWSLPITRVQKEKNWVSPTRADQYGIEKIRVDYNVKKQKAEDAGKETADTSSDNDVFMIYCAIDGDNYRPVLGSSYDEVSGVLSGQTAYNLELTPKKNLLRHSGYLRGIMDRMDGRYINFASGSKNTELVTVKDGIIVKENENVISSSLQGKYFLPCVATFPAKMPRNVMWLVDNTPFGYISFSYKGTKLKGYLMNIAMDVARNTEREFKLLLTHDNNLLNLI